MEAIEEDFEEPSSIIELDEPLDEEGIEKKEKVLEALQ